MDQTEATVQFEVDAPAATVTYRLRTDKFGVCLYHGGWGTTINCLINGQGLVMLTAAGYPAKLLGAAQLEWEKWVEAHPPGERICEDWYLQPDPTMFGGLPGDGGPAGMMAKGPGTEVFFFTDGRWPRIHIQHELTSYSKSAPVEVILALIKANE